MSLVGLAVALAATLGAQEVPGARGEEIRIRFDDPASVYDGSPWKTPRQDRARELFERPSTMSTSALRRRLAEAVSPEAKRVGTMGHDRRLQTWLVDSGAAIRKSSAHTARDGPRRNQGPLLGQEKTLRVQRPGCGRKPK